MCPFQDEDLLWLSMALKSHRISRNETLRYLTQYNPTKKVGKWTWLLGALGWWADEASVEERHHPIRAAQSSLDFRLFGSPSSQAQVTGILTNEAAV